MTAKGASKPARDEWEERTELPDSERDEVAGAEPAREGEFDPDEPIKVTLLLAPDPASKDRLQALHLRTQGRTAPGQRGPYGQRTDLIAANQPSDEALLRVGMFAGKYGLTPVGHVRPPGLLPFVGSWRSVEAAFDTKLKVLRQPLGDGRFVVIRQRIGKLSLPNPVADVVEGVFSSDSRRQARIQMHAETQDDVQTGDAKMWTGDTVTIGTAKDGNSSFTPRNLAKLYEFPDGLDGRGQTIGIIALGGSINPRALTEFFDRLPLPVPAITQIVADGIPANLGDEPAADDELQLDVQMAGSVAPGAHIVVYLAPNTSSGYLHALAAAVYDQVHRPTVITSSWGLAEERWTEQARKAIDRVLRDAASLGVTVCVAAGDYGSADDRDDREKARADFPASSPYALACGGTQFDLDGDAIAELGDALAAAQPPAERVWNNGKVLASGGGVSAHFPRPEWQDNIAVTRKDLRQESPPERRAIPDVAANADPRAGCVLRFPDPTDPKRRQVVAGGTSAVAPLWAGLIARMNQALPGPVGYLNPYLYESVDRHQAFADIERGDNGEYRAGEGWDACTGFGRMRGQGLLDQLR